jgi:uncharacterized membrane protein YqaE (UPF0057 family)
MLNTIIYINKKQICLNTIPKDINTNTIDDIITYTTNFNNYYILYNNKLLSKHTNLNKLINDNYNSSHSSHSSHNSHNSHSSHNTHSIIYLNVIERQLGGGGFIDMFMAIIQIGDLFVMIFKFLKWIGLFIYWFVRFLLWLFTDLLNPLNFITDFFNSLVTLVIALCRLPFDLILGLMALSINTVGGWMQGFWGWDQSSLTKADRESIYFTKINRSKGKKCYLTNTNTVPFSIILGTILCPPIGVFMDMGLTGWLNILICILLTLLFYIPGLVYALLIIYA